MHLFEGSQLSAVLSCLVLSCLVLSCLVLSCLVLSCLVLSCLVLSCLVLSCLVFHFPFSLFLCLLSLSLCLRVMLYVCVVWCAVCCAVSSQELSCVVLCCVVSGVELCWVVLWCDWSSTASSGKANDSRNRERVVLDLLSNLKWVRSKGFFCRTCGPRDNPTWANFGKQN